MFAVVLPHMLLFKSDITYIYIVIVSWLPTPKKNVHSFVDLFLTLHI